MDPDTWIRFEVTKYFSGRGVSPSALPAMKPFLTRREAFQKQRRRRLLGDQNRGFVMIALILNSIYRHFLRTSIYGAKVAGA
jgi:hypothetical protein